MDFVWPARHPSVREQQLAAAMTTRQTPSGDGSDIKTSVGLRNFQFTFNCSSMSCGSSRFIETEVGAPLFGPARLSMMHVLTRPWVFGRRCRGKCRYHLPWTECRLGRRGLTADGPKKRVVGVFVRERADLSRGVRAHLPRLPSRL